MKIDYKKLGKEIKKKREEKGYIQKELEIMLNISYGYISQVETGSKHPSLQSLVDIANALDTTLDELLGFEIDKKAIEIIYKEVNELFDDCSPKERKLLYENMKFFKEQMIEHREK